MLRTHPALDFPLYGLDRSWRGPRWLEFIEGQAGDPVWTVWLGHGRTRAPQPAEPWLLVATMPRERHARLMNPGGAGHGGVAWAAMLQLTGRTEPRLNGAQLARYQQAKTRLVIEQAEGSGSWQQVTWVVDGEFVAARIFQWAGAWCGFTTDLPEVDVVVVATGADPAVSMLTKLNDTRVYRFDANHPLAYPDVLDASVHAALGDAANTDLRWPLHPDQAQLLT